jgi:uncharacterized damage-inducible protein DinB
MDSEVAEIIRQIRDGYTGEPWHGYATLKILEGIGAGQAFARPLRDVHSIAEIVRHMVSWQDEVRYRLQGQAPGLPPEGDWPEAGPGTESEWQSCLEKLRESTGRLLDFLTTLPAAALNRRVGSSSDRSLATGMSVRAMLYGVVSHNAYHSGQIAILKKEGQRE